MPNLCSYGMKVVGTKENKDKLLEIMKRGYDCTKEDDIHMWRVFDAYRNSYKGDDEELYFIGGNCAWSVYSCMFDGPGTYQQRDETGKGTTIVQLSKDLNLDIEIFSEEPGIGFMEHYIIRQGDVTTNDVVDYYEYDIEEYDTYEQFLEDCPDAKENVTKDMFDAATKDGEQYIYVGGMEWDYEI